MVGIQCTEESPCDKKDIFQLRVHPLTESTLSRKMYLAFQYTFNDRKYNS